MKSKADNERTDKRGEELRVLAEAVAKKPMKGSSIDEVSLESRRRAIAYGRARGNA